MNFPFQGTITSERGRITSVIPNTGEVTIITERDTHNYPGAWLYPGFTDTHAHIFGLGTRLAGISLYHCSSAEECIEILQNNEPTNGNWSVGMGWNQEMWINKEYPDKKILDRFFPETPVYLSRADGHAAWVNSAALKMANISSLTPSPNGGEILKLKSGELSGILVDNAMDLVKSVIPALSQDEIKKRIILSTKQCAKWGLTEIHDMDVHPSFLPIFREMAENGTLPVRVVSYLSAQNDEWDKENLLPAVGEFLQVAGIKFYADGALGSRGAALLQPYSDQSDTNGLFLIDEESLFSKAKLGIEAGWQIATHAIGDAANRMVLNVYERLRKAGFSSDDNLLRIEHAQIVHPEDLGRFIDNNIYAAVQPIHCSSDARMAEQRLGSRCTYAYPYRSLLKSGAVIGGSSDFPIESGNPLLGIDSFVRRIPFGENNTWYSDETISRVEALQSYTKFAHYLSGNEYRRGEIAYKFDSDFTVLDKNLLECSDNEIPNTQVVATYTAGIRRYFQQ